MGNTELSYTSKSGGTACGLRNPANLLERDAKVVAPFSLAFGLDFFSRGHGLEAGLPDCQTSRSLFRRMRLLLVGLWPSPFFVRTSNPVARAEEVVVSTAKVVVSAAKAVGNTVRVVVSAAKAVGSTVGAGESAAKAVGSTVAVEVSTDKAVGSIAKVVVSTAKVGRSTVNVVMRCALLLKPSPDPGGTMSVARKTRPFSFSCFVGIVCFVVKNSWHLAQQGGKV